MDKKILLTYCGYKDSMEPEDYVSGYEWLETIEELQIRCEILNENLYQFGIIDALEIKKSNDIGIRKMGTEDGVITYEVDSDKTKQFQADLYDKLAKTDTKSSKKRVLYKDVASGKVNLSGTLRQIGKGNY